MAEANRNPDPRELDPAKIEQLLDIELMQKRAEWKQTKGRHGNLRAISFLFLFAVIVAALLAFFFLFSSDRVNELKTQQQSVQPTPLPAGSP